MRAVAPGIGRLRPAPQLRLSIPRKGSAEQMRHPRSDHGVQRLASGCGSPGTVLRTKANPQRLHFYDSISMTSLKDKEWWWPGVQDSGQRGTGSRLQSSSLQGPRGEGNVLTATVLATGTAPCAKRARSCVHAHTCAHMTACGVVDPEQARNGLWCCANYVGGWHLGKLGQGATTSLHITCDLL